jgi:hypothetical protein
MLHEHLAQMGRRGDTQLAHVTKGEMALLKALGGAGTRNPKTGLPEFWESDGSGFGGVDTGASQGPNADGTTLDSGGGGGMGDFQGPTQDGTPLGGGLGELQGPTYDGTPLGGGVVGDLQGPTYDGTPLGGGVVGDLQGPTQDGTVIDPNAGRGGFFNFDNLGRRIMDEINPRTQQGLFNTITGMVPGFGWASRGMYGLADALGEYVGRPLNEAFGGTAPAMAMDFGNPERFSGDQFAGIDMGPSESQRDLVGALAGASPISNPVPPAFYGRADTNPTDDIAQLFGPGLDDLQRRAQIATYGTQGVNSSYRGDPMKRYYAKLLNNAMVDAGGKPVSNPYTLPVEQLYWQSVLGRNVGDPSDPTQVLNAIRGWL